MCKPANDTTRSGQPAKAWRDGWRVPVTWPARPAEKRAWHFNAAEEVRSNSKDSDSWREGEKKKEKEKYFEII